MITTRDIDVDLSKGGKLNRVTTKDVDASPKVKLPKKPVKATGISTSNIADVADIREKKRRDDIAIEKKLAMKDEKKLIINEKGEANKGFKEGDAVYQEEKKTVLVDNEGYAVAFIDETGFKKLNTQFVFAEIDDLVQAVSRRELK